MRLKLFLLSSVLLIAPDLFSYDYESSEFKINITSDIEHTVELAGTTEYFRTTEGYERLILNPIGYYDYSTGTAVGYNITSIGSYGFAWCHNLAYLEIPKTVKVIGQYAFYNCEKLSTIKIPNSVTHIHNNAFDGCSSLERLTIPSSVTYINSDFGLLENLKSVTVEWQDPSQVDAGLYLGRAGITLYVPKGTKEKYEASDSWNFFEIEEGRPVKVELYGMDGSVELVNDPYRRTIMTYVACDTIAVPIRAYTSEDDKGYHFVRWSNGSTKAIDTLMVYSDTLLWAYFEECTSVTDTAVPATCHSTGLTAGTHCSVCGNPIDAQQVVERLAHTVVVDTAVDATCTKTGLTEGKHCSVCDSVLVVQKIIPKAQHSIVIDSAIAATCTKTGLTEGKHCTVCDSVLVAQKIAPKAEHIIAIDSAVSATCTKTGLTEGKHCSVCDSVLVVQQIVSKTSHTIAIDSAVVATCVKTGLTEGKHCSACDSIIVVQQITPMVPHTYVVDSAVSATCTESGLTIGSHCSVCDTILIVQDTIAALGHLYKDYIFNYDATTETDGTETAICEHGCGETDTRLAEGTKLVGIYDEEPNTISICVVDNTVVVKNAETEISIFDVTGRCVAKRQANSDITEINLPNQGLYIVKTGIVSKKVVLNK